MKIQSVELREVALPLVTPFRTSVGSQDDRNALLVKVTTADGAVGWGECVAEDDPYYFPEYLSGEREVIRRWLAPTLAAETDLRSAQVPGLLGPLRAHTMAKAAIEMAVLDAELRDLGVSLAQHLGAVHSSVPVGVSVGITDTLDELLKQVENYLAEGYSRVKLKIEPGWDLEPVRLVREAFGDDLALQVDANTAYGLVDIPHLRRLDDFGLVLIEQPFQPDDLDSHVRLAARIDTPVCLDESIRSARDAATALRMDACSIINIKPGRVGGYLESRRIHDLCSAVGVPVWCGGMLETGLGRAANLALAALPGFTLPGDISATARYYERDITAAFVLEDGQLRVPDGPGIGILPDPDALEDATTAVETLTF
ncbi:o-succinylbenzoate synthase [Knoellia subterranea]|uniref:o-succinylbenzoate synthase n=1 Tax=Knoellia subterranea KCTC 19937 TaxID=1385521 RepID=A0A0A0JSM4_9MICO|nr:o-succinylbenzoate synthase [Knoellia subterranea]KGN39047.1 O-succinylbenzoate synthase [Knoellia subterranea KCTC 19937]